MGKFNKKIAFLTAAATLFGALTLPGEDVIPGVRPMIAVDLEKIAFTAGSGTAEEPFCIN